MRYLKLLGGLSIEADGGPVTGRAAQRRRLALLALLAMARAGGQSRDRLIAHLWPEASQENGRSYLSDSVYRINQALGGEVIVAAGDELRLDAARLPNDVADFEAALTAGDFERAVTLYSGPFLDGFFLPDAPELERWSELERERLHRAFAEALESLAELAASGGDRPAAVGWWRRLAALDPYNSRIALRFMEALDAAGERAAAIQHARIHETLMREELEVEPDAGVSALAEVLRSGRAETGRTNAPAPEPTRDRPEVLDVVRPRPRARLATVTLVAAVTLALALGGLAQLRDGHGDDPAAGGQALRSIAVLPFTSLSPDQADEYFSDGITEELIATLGRVSDLKVASRSSVFAYKGKPTDVREVGRRLGVDAVIEGSVRKAGSALRISAQLVSTASGYTLWSRVYDRELDDALVVQEEIAHAMVQTLTGAPAGAVPVVPVATPSQTPEAYDLYLKGRYAWHQRTRAGLMRAIEFFERATALAPEYARAYAGLADAYAVAAFYDHLAPRTAYPRAEDAARRALRLDSTLAAPHATLGYILTYYHLDWVAAERSFGRAIALDPDYSTAHQWYANLLTVAARFDEAEREMRLAQEADPLSLIANAALGWSYYFAGRSEDALEQCRRTLALDADYQLAHLWGGWALESMGRLVEARAWIERAGTLAGGDIRTRLALARTLASLSPDSARAILRDAERLAARGDYIPSYEVAKVHLALGNRDSALRWLERAVEERSHSVAFLRVDPQLAALRRDERFERLAASVPH